MSSSFDKKHLTPAMEAGYQKWLKQQEGQESCTYCEDCGSLESVPDNGSYNNDFVCDCE